MMARWTIPSFDTLAVHAGQEPDELTGAVAPPIYQTSTYAQEAVGRPTRGYEYARSQNPTRERLERAVAALEGGPTGSPSPAARRRPPRLAELVLPGEEVIVERRRLRRDLALPRAGRRTARRRPPAASTWPAIRTPRSGRT